MPPHFCHSSSQGQCKRALLVSLTARSWGVTNTETFISGVRIGMEHTLPQSLICTEEASIALKRHDGGLEESAVERGLGQCIVIDILKSG